MNGEIEDVKKRLEAVEKAVIWLGSALCTSTYNHFVSLLHGDDKESYISRWKPKLDSIHKDIAGSSTVDKALQLVCSFCVEISKYALVLKVDTAEKAMEIAHSFIKKYSPVALPLKAIKEGDIWLVDVDVGALAVKVAKIKVDARTGDILSYDIPERK